LRIVFGAFFWIRQDGISLGDFLESLFGPRLLVAVGMIFQRKATEGVLDRLLIGFFVNAEYLVVITLGSNDGSP